MNHSNPFLDLKAKTQIDLPEGDRFPAAGHWWSQPEIDALILAYAARRPLLVRGEAGSGKSQLARAAAKVIGNGLPLVEVIHPRFEAMDLLYRLDVVERLADAQINELDRSNNKYVKPGQLWVAIHLMKHEKKLPVLLIDEIDKADADVPNALLDVLGNRSFNVPPLDNLTVRAEGGRLPLIIITTNEEREMPAAFIRRCVVLNLNPPMRNAGDEAFIDWLKQRGLVHRHLEIDAEAQELAARQVLDDRKVAEDMGYPKVGLAEYIDLLTAVSELTRDIAVERRAEKQVKWLNQLSAYALVKNADQPQNREPVAPIATAKETSNL